VVSERLVAEKLNIYTYPDPVLKARAEEVTDIDGELQKLIEDMGETMYDAPGIGLAANQIGILKRMLVYDVEHKSGEGRKLSVLINPEIVDGEGKIVHDEACLSVIDFSADVTRYAMIKVRGYDRHEKPVDIEAEGLLAICLQHEIDHLNGKLFLDHIGSLKRSLYKRRLQKMLKKQKDSETRE
jgi:peptide deformylase